VDARLTFLKRGCDRGQDEVRSQPVAVRRQSSALVGVDGCGRLKSELPGAAIAPVAQADEMKNESRIGRADMHGTQGKLNAA
jgi:hypothetical protein